ncbi:MAG: hypothetical protein ACFHWZ_13865 [Phycisphaerales bacterium]
MPARTDANGVGRCFSTLADHVDPVDERVLRAIGLRTDVGEVEMCMGIYKPRDRDATRRVDFDRTRTGDRRVAPHDVIVSNREKFDAGESGW